MQALDLIDSWPVDNVAAAVIRPNGAVDTSGDQDRQFRVASVAKPIDYLLRRWERFTPFLHDGRICLSNNAAERALRGFALGRKSWLFAGSERGAARAAAMPR